MLDNHKRLHESAKQIKKTYKSIHPELTQLLLNRLIDHKNWTEKVSVAILEGNPELGVQIDPNKCALGKFLSSSEYQHYAKDFPQFKTAIEGIREAHKALHQSAIEISEVLSNPGSHSVPGEGPQPTSVDHITKARNIYKTQTLAALEIISEGFHQAIYSRKGIN